MDDLDRLSREIRRDMLEVSKRDLVSVLGSWPLAVTVEAHCPNGGVGSLVAEVVAEHGLGCRVLRRAIGSMPRGVSGEPTYLYEHNGLSARRVADAVLTALAVSR